MGQDRKSTHQLSSQEKQSHCGEIWFNLLLINHRVEKWKIKRNKRHLPLTLLVLRLNFAPESPTFSPWVVQADGECMFCSVGNTLPLPVNPFCPLSLFQWGISPTWHSLTDWSSMCYSQGLLFFRSRRLQHGLPAGSTSPVKILGPACAPLHRPQLPLGAFCFTGSL